MYTDFQTFICGADAEDRINTAGAHGGRGASCLFSVVIAAAARTQQNSGLLQPVSAPDYYIVVSLAADACVFSACLVERSCRPNDEIFANDAGLPSLGTEALGGGKNCCLFR